MRCLLLVLLAGALLEARPGARQFPLAIVCPEQGSGRLDRTTTRTCLWASRITLTYEPARGESGTGSGPECSWKMAGGGDRVSRDWRGTQIYFLQPGEQQVTVECADHARFTLVLAYQDIQFFLMVPFTPPVFQYEVVKFGWCARLGHISWIYSFSPRAEAHTVLIPHVSNTTIAPESLPTERLRATCPKYWSFIQGTRYTRTGLHEASLVLKDSPMIPLTVSVQVDPLYKHIFTATSRQLGSHNLDLAFFWRWQTLVGHSMSMDLADLKSMGGWSVSLDNHSMETELCVPGTIPIGSSLIARIYFLPGKGPIKFHVGRLNVSNGSIVRFLVPELIDFTLEKPQNTPITYYSSVGFYFSNRDSSSSVGHYIFFNHERMVYLFHLDFTANVLDKCYIYLYMDRTWDYKLLKDMDMGIKLFNSGPSDLFTLVHVVWFIPKQHLFIQCKWSFTLEIYGSRKAYLEKRFTYIYSDKIEDAQQYLPKLSLSFDPMLYVGFVATVNFGKSGRKPAVLKASVGTYATKVLETLIYIHERPCDFTDFIIQKPSHSMPIIIWKGTQETLYATLQMNCSKVEKVIILWKIYELYNRTSVPDWTMDLNIPAITPKNQSNLLIPRFSLNYGFYLFNVSISITTYDDKWSTVTETDSVIVEVKQQGLKAVIEGGSGRSVGFRDMWQLNGQLSADPDSTDPLDGISFSWYCTQTLSDYETMTLSSNAACSPLQTGLAWTNPNSPIQNVDPAMLEGNKQYYFRLVIRKGHRTAFADQSVLIKPGDTPTLTIHCIENCNKNVIPTDRFVLSGKCLDCLTDSIRPRYEWILFVNGAPEVTFDWGTYTRTGNLKPYLSSKAFSFKDLVNKNFTLSLTVVTWTGAPSFYWYNFTVNALPMNGSCNIQPNEGITFVTFFIVNCSEFSAHHTPLSYMVIAGSHDLSNITPLANNILGTIVYSGYNPVSLPFHLPIGEVSKMHKLPIYVNVHDSLGASTRVDLFAVVKDPSTSHRKLLDEMAAIISGPHSPMAFYIRTGDYLKATNLISMVASDLNNGSSFEFRDNLSKRIKLRENMLTITSNLLPESITAINQIVTSISKVAMDSKELNMKSRQLAVGKLAEVANKLSELRVEILTSVLTEQLSTGLLSALSSVMDACLLNVNHADITAISPEDIDVLKQVLSTLEVVAEIVMYGKVPGEQKTIMESSNWIVHLVEEELWDINRTYLTSPGCKNCFYPTFLDAVQNLPKDSIVWSLFYEFKKNPFPWLRNGRDIQTMVTGFQITAITKEGNRIAITPDVVDIIDAIQNESVSIIMPITMGPVPNRTIISGSFGFEFDLERTTELWLQFSPTVSIGFNVSVHLGYNSSETLPIASYQVPVKAPLTQKGKHSKASVQMVDSYLLTIPLGSILHSRPKSLWNITILLLSNYQLSENTDKLLTISISTYSCLDFDAVSNSWETGNCKVGPLTNHKQMHCVCHFLRTKINAKANNFFLKKLHRFFGGKIWIPPNAVDFRKIILSDLQRNLVVLSTVLLVFAVYIVVAIWAWKKDRADIVIKDQVVILPDNDPFDNICYLVTIYTGSRCGAGTTADVFLKLVGTFSESRVHLLKHIGYSAFFRGGLDTFLLTTKYELGELYFLRIWHNNGGNSPGWFLSRVKVENMYTKQVWYFMCRKWLAVDKADGLIDRTFSVTNPELPLKKNDYFLINISGKLEDNHLWFSIFALSMAWPFTRLQRLSCCLTMLLCSFLTSIALYNLEATEKEMTMENYLRTIVVGVQSSLVTVPIQFILSALFRDSLRRRKPNTYIPYQAYAEFRASEECTMPNDASFWVSHVRPIGWKEHLYSKYTTKTSSDSAVASSSTSVSPQLPPTASIRRRKVNNCVVSESAANILTVEEEESVATKEARKNHWGPSSTPPSLENRNNQNSSSQTSFRNVNNQNTTKMIDVEDSLTKKKSNNSCQNCFILVRKKTDIVFSWWCTYVGWTVILLVSAIASFSIILYGLSYGTETSKGWLLASIVSFIQSVFIMQTIQIFFLSAVGTYSLKYLHHIPWGNRRRFLEIRVGELSKDSDEMRELHYELVKIRSSKRYRPLEEDEILIIKKRNAIKNKAFIFLKGIVSHFIFVTLVLNLAYSNDNMHVFLYNRAIASQFSSNLSAVDRLDHIYVWMTTVFLPSIHNPDHPNYLSGSWSMIVGLARMRQMRAKPAVKKCFRTNSFIYETRLGKSHCLHRYGIDEEDRLNYTGFWNAFPRALTQVGFYHEPNTSPWSYYSYGDSYVYGTGGYSVYFFPEKDLSNSINVLRDLQQNAWLDERTWAVLIELTTFNSDVSLFCTISVVFEASPVGLVHSRLSVHSFTLMVVDQLDSMEIATIIILFVFLCIYVADEIYTICQQKLHYLKQLTNLINFGLKSVFCIVVCLQVVKFYLASSLLTFYSRDPYQFTPFHTVSYVDLTLRITIGFLAFFAILKTLRYATFFYSVRLAQRSVYAALPGICSMSVVVAVYFFAYMAFGYLVFGQDEWSHNNLGHSAQTVLSYCVTAFRDTLYANNRILGGIYLTSFMVVMICIVINLFQAVIISAYHDMKQPVYEEPSDEAEVMAFLVHKVRKILASFGNKKPTKREPEVLNSVLYGQPDRERHQTLGLKTKKVNGKKMVYLLI